MFEVFVHPQTVHSDGRAVCGRALAGVAGSNSAASMAVS